MLGLPGETVAPIGSMTASLTTAVYVDPLSTLLSSVAPRHVPSTLPAIPA
jgi:hypothetical protein